MSSIQLIDRQIIISPGVSPCGQRRRMISTMARGNPKEDGKYSRESGNKVQYNIQLLLDQVISPLHSAYLLDWPDFDKRLFIYYD